jgi:hypothetical protein
VPFLLRLVILQKRIYKHEADRQFQTEVVVFGDSIQPSRIGTHELSSLGPRPSYRAPDQS